LIPLALIVAAIAISFAAIFFRKASPTHPLVSAGIRLAIAGCILLPFTWRRCLALTPSVRRYGVLGGVFYAIHFGAWVWSIELTTIAASVTLVTATPILLAIYGWVTGRDRPTGRLIWTIGISALGIILIAGADFGSGWRPLVGDALALVGAAAMAAYMLTVRRLGHIDLGAFLTIAILVGAALLGTAALLVGIPIRPASSEALVWLVLAALIPQLVGHSLLTWCLRHTAPTQVAMATVAEPAGATVVAWAWLGDTVSPVVLIGCVLTVTAVAVSVQRTQA
jgi:drug/metabolite transporter (DMT)-like permease